MNILFISIIAQAVFLVFTGDWPEPRQNACLTGVQPLPGAMIHAPSVLARHDLGSIAPATRCVRNRDGLESYLAIVGGALHAFDPYGKSLWISHPPGLNYVSISASEDLDGDGEIEVLLQAGRPAAPYGAAVIIDLRSGILRWRYDVEPMSYAWYLFADAYSPKFTGKQIIILMQGYPPDEKNGYMVLFAADPEKNTWRQQWHYEFHQYTCFPSLLRSDYDGDGIIELAVETHSRMWFFNPENGEMEYFTSWDVAPANVRSYGHIEFADLNRDGMEDFFCVADFAQHHEVLLNRNGRFERAWLQAWGESVTTGKVATAFPRPVYGNVDDDESLEMVLSIFNGENENAWAIRVYDATTGIIEHKIRGFIPILLADIDGDGILDIASNRAVSPDISLACGGSVLGVRKQEWVEKWALDGARFLSTAPGELPRFEHTGAIRTLQPGEKGKIVEAIWQPSAVTPSPEPKQIPHIASATMSPTILLANLSRGGNELLVHGNGTVRVLQWQGTSLSCTGTYVSLSPPVTSDLDNDGNSELVRAEVLTEGVPVVEAITPALANRVLWRTILPPLAGTHLPNGQAAYLRSGRFSGHVTSDLYVWFGAPCVRSVCLDGKNGQLLWEQGNRPEIERHWGPSINLASVHDYDGDGAEDLVFTNPDYYCVARGQTGTSLLGPLFPPDIFQQPSQGLYTLPALLTQATGEPLVCLCDGHYFHAVMTINAKPRWYAILKPGESPTGAEGFLRLDNGAWLMGMGRQNGMFAGIDASIGVLRWEFPVEASCTDVITCDVDGDKRLEFVFATSHGALWAIGDGGTTPRIVWRAELDAPAEGSPIAGDVNQDGKSELIVPLANGTLVVLGE